MGFKLEFKLSPGSSGEPGPPPSLLALLQLIATNAIALGVAVSEHWPLMLLLVPYWLQSVVVGWFARERILALRQFSVEGLDINGTPATETPETRDLVANFLPLHYGLFCTVHAALLGFFAHQGRFGAMEEISAWDAVNGLLVAVLFFFVQRGEHRRNLEADRDRRPSLGAMVFLPYLRVIPMHLTVLIAAGKFAQDEVVLIFGLLKMMADVAMFLCSHGLTANAAPATAMAAPTVPTGSFGAAVRQRLARSRERLAVLRSRTIRRDS